MIEAAPTPHRTGYAVLVRAVGFILYCVLFVVGTAVYVGVAGQVIDTVHGPQPALRVWWALISLGLIGGSVLVAQVARGWALLLLTGAIGVATVVVVGVGMGAGVAIAALIWLGVVATGLGDLLLTRLGSAARWTLVERVAIGLLLGLGSVGFIAAVLATVHLFLLPIVLSLLVVLTLPAAVRVRALINAARTTRPRAYWLGSDARLPAVCLAWLVICFGGAFLWASTPAIHYDAVWYHLPVAQLDARNGGFSDLPYYGRWRLIGLGHMLYSLGFLLVGQPLPGLVHWQFGPLIAALLWSLARRLVGTPAGWAAAVAFALLPLVEWEAGSAYIDLFVTGFFFGSVYLVARWWEERLAGLLVVGGLLGGMALAVKLNAGLLMLPLAAIVVIGCLPRPDRWRSLIAFFLPLAVVPVPWFLRSWSDVMERVLPFASKVSAGTGLEQERVWLRFGMGNGPVELLRLPYDLVFHGEAFDEIGWGMLGLVPLLCLAAPFVLQRTERRRFVPLFVVVVGGLLLWFRSVQVARYLLPLVPVLVVLAVAPVPVLWRYVAERRPWRPVTTTLALLVVVVYVASTRVVAAGWGYQLYEGYPIRLALGRESRTDFLRRTMPVYPIFERLNQDAGADARVLSAGIPFHLYLDGDLEDNSHDPDVTRLAPIPPGPELAQALAARGYTHILTERRLVVGDGGPNFSRPGFLAAYARPVLANGDLLLYQFMPAGSSP